MRILLLAWLQVVLQSTLCVHAAPAQPIVVGTNIQLFVDMRLVETIRGVSLRLHPPSRREAVFQFDAPWEGQECGYVSMLKDQDRYRMYYRGGGETTKEVTCLAESDDGVRWTRPKLGLFEFNGSKENNIVWVGRTKSYSESHNFTPFIDHNPAAKPEERYKAVAFTKYKDAQGENQRGLAALVSPNGIHWKRMREEPIQKDAGFDSQNLAFWDTMQKQYVCYFREGRNGVRSVRRSVSPDFLNWSPPVWLEFGNTPPEHFYTSAITPYFRNPAIYLGFPLRFVPERKKVGMEKRPVDALSDGVLMSSHDGIHFQRQFMEAFIRPGLDMRNWGNGHGNNTPAWGLLPTAPDEISIYWSEHYAADYSRKGGRLEEGRFPQLRRGTLRVDGFASVHAAFDEGEFLTKPLQTRKEKLLLNVSTSAIGSLRAEVQDVDGKVIPGFALADCEEIYGDETERIVAWKTAPNFRQLRDHPFRLRFVMKDADLYSIRFTD